MLYIEDDTEVGMHAFRLTDWTRKWLDSTGTICVDNDKMKVKDEARASMGKTMKKSQEELPRTPLWYGDVWLCRWEETSACTIQYGFT